MTTQSFPDLDPQSIAVTRDALHAYARVLGDWLSACRPRRKHWWHASLRASLNGITTGVIRAGIDNRFIPEAGQPSATGFAGYSAEHAVKLSGAVNSITAAMESFRAGIREETSPIQLWPHHFDLSMLWLPGEKVPNEDPANEEYADKQMNFGFTFGDEGIPEPYFYVTAYPLPDAFPTLRLPAGTTWQSEGFSGAVLPYQSLLKNTDPTSYLIKLWNSLLSAGRKHLLENQTEGPRADDARV